MEDVSSIIVLLLLPSAGQASFRTGGSGSRYQEARKKFSIDTKVFDS
jgi:hypothetical protein